MVSKQLDSSALHFSLFIFNVTLHTVDGRGYGDNRTETKESS